MRARLGRVPRAAWLCTAVAIANALVWAVITPAFWVPDEVASTGYVQEIGETGRLPAKGQPGLLSREQVVAVSRQPFAIEGKPSWNAPYAAETERLLESGRFKRYAKGQSQYLSSYSPLYYATEAIPYRIARGASIIDRLLLMRALSTLLAGMTVLFTFLFLRELIPRTPWTWTVGALALAFQPMLGFLGGGVSNDNLLFTCAAALFFGLARAFRRGLDVPSALLIGLAGGLGAAAKPTMFGLFPGVVLGLMFLLLRRSPGERRAGVRPALLTLVLMIVPYALWTVISAQAGSSAGSAVSTSTASGVSSMAGRLSYIWQAMFPRLPFMEDQIPHYVPWEIYFKGFVGRFGWFEYGFAPAWYWVALAILVPILVAAAVGAARAIRVDRRRAGELVTYLAMGLGAVLLVEVVSYNYHAIYKTVHFEQGRYLFTLLPLFAALVAVAAKGVGRWGPALGAAMVTLAMGWSVFSQLLTIARFYT